MTLCIDYNSVYHRKDRKLTDQVVHAEPRCRTGAAGDITEKITKHISLVCIGIWNRKVTTYLDAP